MQSTNRNSIETILNQTEFTRNDIKTLLTSSTAEDIELLRSKAESVLLDFRGDNVYYRGLIEFSNICSSDCYYCGIRKSNKDVRRYTLDTRQIVSSAIWCAEQGYGSVVLQSGERRDSAFTELIVETVKAIKASTVSEQLPQGLGITLCVGEQTKETYQKFHDAGAHRYLLRIETTSPALFKSIHPPAQTLESRLACLRHLQEVGFQVGTGVMIGLPDQTVEDLANDVLFFKSMDIDMIGMGPYIVHPNTPMNIHENAVLAKNDYIYQLALNMIAVTRIVLKDVNIAATTALQAMRPQGREDGLLYGANVIMPQLTPLDVRKDYLLYEGKPCLDEDEVKCKNCLAARITSVGRTIGYNLWGDSLHFTNRTTHKNQ